MTTNPARELAIGTARIALASAVAKADWDRAYFLAREIEHYGEAPAVSPAAIVALAVAS